MVLASMERAAARVIASGQHAGGAERAAFEEELASFCGVSHAVAVQSGSAALHLALLVLGVPRGSSVIAPSYACGALLHAIDAVGGSALLADIDPVRLTVTRGTARDACARATIREEQVSAVIVPHMLGIPAPLEGWDFPSPVIEDAAMGIGTEIGGRPAGSIGTVGIVSFYATKMLSTGQGGALLTSDAALADAARDRIRSDGREQWRPSWNYPLSDLAAAIGRPQLAALPEWLERRRAIAGRYRAAAEIAECAGAELPEGANHYRFLLRFPDRAARDAAEVTFRSRGITAKPPVFRPLHRYLGLPDHEFPVTTEVWETGLSVPIYPSLSEAEVDRVAEAIEEWVVV